MTPLLLDTNALLWLLSDDPRLGRHARTRISSGAPVHFSSVAILEVTIKVMLARLEVPGDPHEAATAAGLVELDFTSADARALGDYPALARHDPFDRMMLAQAAQRRLDLLTSDRALLALGHDWVIDACA